MTARPDALARDRLADVLSVVTGMAWQWHTSTYSPAGADVRIGERSLRVVYPDGQTVTAPLAITDPREAWEALFARGLVPEQWIENPARAFSPLYSQVVLPCDAANGLSFQVKDLNGMGGTWPIVVRCSRKDQTIDGAKSAVVVTRQFGVSVVSAVGPGKWIAMGQAPSGELPPTTAHPPALEACVAVAANVDRLVSAESIARELVHRTEKTCPARVEWHFVSHADFLARVAETNGSVCGAAQARAAQAAVFRADDHDDDRERDAARDLVFAGCALDSYYTDESRLVMLFEMAASELAVPILMRPL